MLKNRNGFSLIKTLLILIVLFGLTWYASYYMGREDKLIRDINAARGEKTEDMFQPEPENSGKREKAVIPPGTELMPAALNIKGKRKFKKAVQDAIEVLWYADKGTYEFVRDNISEIRNGNNTGFYKENGQRVAEISDKNALYTKTWLAGILAHQAYHSWYDLKQQSKKKKKKGPPPAPGKDSKKKGLNVDLLMSDVTTHETAFAVEERCARFQLQVLKLVGASPAEQRFVLNRQPRDFSYAHDGNFTITP